MKQEEINHMGSSLEGTWLVKKNVFLFLSSFLFQQRVMLEIFVSFSVDTDHNFHRFI